MNKRFINCRGQFFAQDVLIASSIFVFALIIFFSASSSIFFQQSLFENRKAVDETANNVLNALVLSPGAPSSWENGSVSDVNSFGLALTNNELSPQKAVAFANILSSPTGYVTLKHKLGLGKFDLYFRLLTMQDAIVSYGNSSLAGGVVAENAVINTSYRRLVRFNGDNAVLEAVFSVNN
jgi:hypothetical protein